jgi:hypothetical protein
MFFSNAFLIPSVATQQVFGAHNRSIIVTICWTNTGEMRPHRLCFSSMFRRRGVCDSASHEKARTSRANVFNAREKQDNFAELASALIESACRDYRRCTSLQD